MSWQRRSSNTLKFKSENNFHVAKTKWENKDNSSRRKNYLFLNLSVL